MPFLAPIVTGIGGVLSGISTFLGSGTFLAGIVKVGLGLAAQFAVGQLLGPKPQAQAMQLETAYGENLARTVALGRVGTAGHHIYRNNHGKGGRRIQDVYVLSHFRAKGITRIRWKGEWHTIGGAEHPDLGFRIQDTGEAFAWVKFYSGSMTQAADPYLRYMSNPAGRWTTAHRLAGVSYAVVNYNLDREHLPQPLDFFVELDGTLLYDWRKDSSVGGTGPHRWSNPSTWEFSTNPVLMMYALERGISNGTERMVGKGVPASRLPLAEWTIAANICDEQIEGKKRYQAGIFATSGQGSTHAANMQPLLDACAASWVETAAGEYPIVGANQAVVATFTDDDVVVDEAFRFAHKRTRTELVNTAAGSYSSPDNFYASSPLATRIDNLALAADGERLAVSIPYGAVTHVEVGDRLLDIAIRASRYQANAEICLHPKFIRIQPGRWVRFNSTKHGDRKFLVLQKRLGAIGTNSARNVYLTLQEVGDGVFDPTAYVTVPPDVVIPGAPDYLAEVENFRVVANIIQDQKGTKRPGARVSWNAIEDPTVTHVQLRYRPVGQLEVMLYETDTADVVVRQLANGLTSSSDWEVSSRPLTRPSRAMAWSAWVPFTTLDARMSDITADLAALQQDIREYLEGRKIEFDQEFVDLRTTLANILTRSSKDIVDAQTFEKRIGKNSAAITLERRLRVDDKKAFAEELRLLESRVNLARANAISLLRTEVTEGPNGFKKAVADAMQIVNSRLDDPKTGLIANSTATSSLRTEVIDGPGGTKAISKSLTTVEAMAKDATANGLIRWTAVAGKPVGVSARFAIEGKAAVNGAYRFAGAWLDIYPNRSEWLFKSDIFKISDGTATGTPFVFEKSELKAAVARIGKVYFDQLLSNNEKMRLLGFGTNASYEIIA